MKKEKNTKGLKFDKDKCRLDLLPFEVIWDVGKVLTFGAKKYYDNNWKKGISWMRVLGASLRHIFSFIGGEDKDKETGLSHLSHAICCLMFVAWYESNRQEFDNRPKDRRK